MSQKAGFRPKSYEQPRYERGRFRRAVTAGLLAALAFNLAGCSDAKGEPRNAPASAEYSTDVNPDYYQNVAMMDQYTDNPLIKTRLAELQKEPVAEWLTGDIEHMRRVVERDIAASQEAGSIPVFVSYAIPNRDNDGESRGGFESEEAYEAWIDALSDQIGDSSTVVILEPDALPHLPDLSESQANSRIELLRYALGTLQENNKNTAVYLDAGNSTWRPAETTAALLERIGLEYIPGISLNVANRRSDEMTREYAEAVSAAAGKEFYVMIDSSLNGAEDTNGLDWCNPEGQLLGTLPDTRFDADEKIESSRIKTPGASDGVCGISDAPAGEFDGDLLFHQLGQRP